MKTHICQFEPSDKTSSATICKWCGKEKSRHNIVFMSSNIDKYRIKKTENGFYYSEEGYWDEYYLMAYEFITEKEAIEFATIYLKNENIIIEKFYKL